MIGSTIRQAVTVPVKILNTTAGVLLNPLSFADRMKGDLNSLVHEFTDTKLKILPLPKNSTLKLVEEDDAKMIFNYAGASLCGDTNLTYWNCTFCSRIPTAKVYGIYLDPSTEGRAISAVDTTKGIIALAFRGTSNIQNWLQNSKFVLTELYPGKPGVEVHSGFKLVTDNLFSLYKEDLKTLLEEYPDYKVVVTGHSLGGAISTLSTIKVKDEFNVSDDKLINVSYGSPRVGNYDFAYKYNYMKHSALRVTNARDIVPHFPPRSMNYVHVLAELWVKNSKSKGKLCNNKIFEDGFCSISGEPYLLTKDHLAYWELSLTDIC
ncbi:alpha/beta-hydrolase [Neoconidiobolus thromboides FSU 785]|nr:alpha/beta-hydrolase [Neoconidiobolus thromboides FSU 785]